MSDDDLLLQPKKKTSKVGKAVYDFMQKEQEELEVGEIINEYAPTYVKEVEEAVRRGVSEHGAPFHIVVLHKKEAWSVNVLRNWFITRKTKPVAKEMWRLFPNFMHTVYEYNGHDLKLLWSLPSPQEAAVILKNWDLYDPTLVKWIRDASLDVA